MFTLNEEMAEFYGILLGDGCISRYVSQGRTRYEIRIDGNSLTDVKYYDYLKKLISKVANKEVKIRYRKNCNGIYIKFLDKEFANYLNKELDFPMGKKGNISISQKILSQELYVQKALRGFFDTDGSIYFTKNNSKIRYYPIIELSTHSQALIKQLKEILDKKGFKTTIAYYEDSVKLNGKPNVIKWMREIGSSSSYKKGRFESWLKKGYFKSTITYLNR